MPAWAALPGLILRERHRARDRGGPLMEACGRHRNAQRIRGQVFGNRM
jgi:hypothetical protein